MNIFVEKTIQDEKHTVVQICKIVDLYNIDARIFLLPAGVKPWHEIFNIELYHQTKNVTERKYRTAN